MKKYATDLDGVIAQWTNIPSILLEQRERPSHHLDLPEYRECYEMCMRNANVINRDIVEDVNVPIITSRTFLDKNLAGL